MKKRPACAPQPSDRPPQDWSEILKGATPEAVAKALLQPRKPLKPRSK